MASSKDRFAAPDTPYWGEIAASWPMIAFCAVGVGFGPILSGYAISLFAGPLMTEFDWSPSDITKMLFVLPVAALAYPILGGAMDRWGERRVTIASILALSVAYCGMTLITANVWSLYVLYGIAMVAGAGAGTIGYARAISARFDGSRGLALALMLSGASIAAILAPPVLNAAIVETGWRGGFVVLALACIVLALPAAALGLPMSRPATTSGPSATLTGVSFRGALRDHRFWLLATCVFLIGAPVMGLSANAKLVFVEHGFADTAAALFVSLIAASVFLGRLVTGLLIDRLVPTYVAATVMVGASVGAYLLSLSDMGVAAIILATMLMGAAQGAELDLLAYFTGRFFGARAYGAIYGTLNIAFMAALPIGATAFALVFEQTGGFDLAFTISTGALFAAGMCFLLLGRIPDLSAVAAQASGDASAPRK